MYLLWAVLEPAHINAVVRMASVRPSPAPDTPEVIAGAWRLRGSTGRMLGSKHKSVGRDLSKEHFLQLTVERITRQRYAQTKAQRSIRLMVYMRWTVGESPELLKGESLQGGQVRGSETTGPKTVE